MDRIALEAGGDAVRAIEGKPSLASIIIPLHFDTVSTNLHRNQFKEAMRNLPETVQNFLTVEMCGTPPGAPEGRILEVIGVFKAFCHQIIMRVPFDPRAIAMVPNRSVVAVSTIIGPELSGEALIDRLNQFTDRAKRHQLNAVLVRESREDVAAAAVRCGFTHVSGDVVGPPVAAITGSYRFRPPFMRIVGVLDTASHQECA
jgi:hypothetical protein